MSSTAPKPAPPPPSRGKSAGGFRLRETLETFATAFILALVFRAYIVEAFVIPTGSMAPTLTGEHSHLRCPNCGWEFDVGWTADKRLPGMVDCPNCRNLLYSGFDPTRSGLAAFFSPDNARRGDRILVLKTPFDLFGTFQPKRWDVVVFKNPSEPKVNYIKRLIGLPGETIQIVDGDIWFKPDHQPQTPWQIAHKPDIVQDTLYQVVYDGDYLAPRPPLEGNRVGPRWQTDGAAVMWKGLDGRVFRFDPAGAGGKETIHLDGKWATDYVGYNGRERDFFSSDDTGELLDEGHVLVGDLAIRLVAVPEDPAGRLIFELSRRQFCFRGVLAYDGTVQLYRFEGGRPDKEQQEPVAGGKIEPLHAFRPVLIEFSQVDWRVRLRVDGKNAFPPYEMPISPDLFQNLIETSDRDQSSRIAIAAEEGRVELRHVRVSRDVFYRNIYASATSAWLSRRGTDSRDPPGHGCAGNPIFLFKAQAPGQDPADDQFFCLGDNSPMSQDGRAWIGLNPAEKLSNRNPRNPDLEARMNSTSGRKYQLGTVPRDYMVGRAFFVYWPWGLPLAMPTLPIVPNVGEMRFIK